MRYLIAEPTNVIVRYPTGSGITIALYDLSDESAVALDDNTFSEIGITGCFYWNTSNITTYPTERTEYLWIATDGASESVGKLVLGGYPDGIKDKTDNLPDDPADQSDVEAAISASEAVLSGEHATLQADLDNPDQYKADVAALALEASVQDVKAKTDGLPASPAPEGEYDATLATLALEANVEGHVTDALDAYDPPTRTEATSDKSEVLSAVSGVENKVDDVQNTADAIQAKTDTIVWTDVEFVKAIEGGRWKLDGSQMVFYDDDNTTEIARFNLFASDGMTPAVRPENIFERRRV